MKKVKANANLYQNVTNIVVVNASTLKKVKNLVFVLSLSVNEEPVFKVLVVKRVTARVVPLRIISVGVKILNIGQLGFNVSKAMILPKVYVVKNVQHRNSIDAVSASYRKIVVKISFSQKVADFVVVKAVITNKNLHHNLHRQEVDLVTSLNKVKVVIVL